MQTSDKGCDKNDACVDNNHENEDVTTAANTIASVFDEINEDDFVAAVYERKWYIGRVEQKDDCEVTFLHKAKQMFRWLQTEDRIWLDTKDLLCKIHTLQPSGKSKRLYKITSEEEKMINEKLANK